MKKINAFWGIPFCLSVLLMSCAAPAATDLPVIDVISAFKNEKPLKMSEFIDHIEYVKLETTPECLIGNGQAIKVGNSIYVKTSNPAKIFVFDNQGKFQRQISRQGKGPGEYVNFAYFDVSPDNKYVAVGGFDNTISLYSTEGQFITSAQTNIHFFSGFLFLNRNYLITYEALLDVTMKGYPIMLARNTNDFEADTVLRMDWETQQSDMIFPMKYSACYLFDGSVNFMEPANDTLYQFGNDHKISTRLIMNCGDRAVTREKTFITSDTYPIPVYPMCETSDYLFINAGFGEDFGVLAYNKKTGETIRLPKTNNSYGPENDLEGIGFSFDGLKKGNHTWTSLLQVSELKSFFSPEKPVDLKLKRQDNFNELKKLTAQSDVNDNPIVRVLYFK
jgi:hypothetical protein